MADIGTIANYAEIIGALLVIGGLGFAIMELRRNREQRRLDAAFGLFHGLESDEFRYGLNILYEMPTGLTRAEMEAKYPEEMPHLKQVIARFERLGTMVVNNAVPLDLAFDFFQPSIMNTWNKMRLYILDLREMTGNPLIGKHTEWLASKIETLGQTRTPTAIEAELDAWRQR